MEDNNRINNYKDRKKNKLVLLILCLSVLMCIISVSYAVWTQVYKGKTINKITTSTLDLTFENEENAILIEKAIPVSDSNGKKNSPYEFELKNKGKFSVNYKLYLVEDKESYINDNCLDKKMDLSSIKYLLMGPSQKSETNVSVLSDEKLYEDTILPGEMQKFSLRLWINSEADASVMGKHFHGKVKVEAIQSNQGFDD